MGKGAKLNWDEGQGTIIIQYSIYVLYCTVHTMVNGGWCAILDVS
jgi:hypothetical protein